MSEGLFTILSIIGWFWIGIYVGKRGSSKFPATLRDQARWCQKQVKFIGRGVCAPVSRATITVDGHDFLYAITPKQEGACLIVAHTIAKEDA